MSVNGEIPARSEAEIDLLELFRILWRYRRSIVVTSVVSVFGGVTYALLAKPVYRADVVVTEVSDRGLGASSSLTSQFGGLASLAGLDLEQGGASRTARAVLQSRKLVEEFINRNDLTSVLLADTGRPPSLWYAVRSFRSRVLEIREDTRRGTTTVSIEWNDPDVAASWASGFVSLANELIRTRALEESNRNIAYLNEQLKRTNVVEFQRVIYNLIESETKTLMVAYGRTEYAFTVVDPAVVPEIRVSPRRVLIVVLAGIFGVLVGALGVLAYHAWSYRIHRA